MELEASLDWVSLSMTPGLGSRLTGKLLRQFGSPEGIFRASLTELEACRLPSAPAQAIHSRQAHKDAEEELAQIRKLGCRLLNWDEPEYPQRLLEIYDPPPLLYVRGDPTALSGTIGILGTGIDVIYPKENRKLFAEVEKRGALISEFPLGSHPAPENFPVRNRVVAGMALGVVVVQGAQYSGSLITARLGMEFGREVYGIPGNITADVSFAPNQLIKQGAKLVTSWEDVVEELPTEVRADLFPVEASTREERASLFADALSPQEKKVFGLLGVDETVHVDELVEKSELTSSEVLAALCEMEMKGIVRQMPGKQFVKVLL